METDIMNNNLGKNSSEEIFAENYDDKKKSNAQSKNDQKQNQNDSIKSSIEFDKHQLFFHSQPNIMSYDTVTIKNTGKTCIYYQWQKNTGSFQLEDKKNDGMDRFFCHYGDDKIYPDEEREFTFSFFSEKNGVFSEEWILVTTPPLPDSNLNIHLNGLVHKYEDFYSENINTLDKKIYNSANNTKINEFVLDLIDTIKGQTPQMPNMYNDKIFSYYFQIYNKEYNIEFSKRVMNNLNKLNNEVMNEVLGIQDEEPKKEEVKEPEPPKQEVLNTEESKDEKETKLKKKETTKKLDKIKDKGKKEEKKEEPVEEPKVEEVKEEPKKEEPKLDEFFFPKNENQEKKFWNGSIDELKKRIELVQDEEKKLDFKNKLNCILHLAHKKGPEDSTVYDFVKKIFLDELENINETSNKIREELSLPPYTFDLLTRQSLNKEDLA